MKTDKFSFLKLSILPVILAFALIFSSCARKMSFGVSSVVPAAQGTVKVKTDKNKNYSINIKIKNLAPADRLTPSKKTYVVWMVTTENVTKNIGQLKSSSKFLSKNLKASLSTVTALKPDYFFITGEDDAQTLYPGFPVVLTTK